MNRSSLGPLVKARETLSVFARSAPSPRELWRNRRQRFERLHVVAPSTVTPGESVSLTVQAWDQCERRHEAYAGTASVSTTDPAASAPASVSFDEADDGVVGVDGLAFETPGVHYVTLTVDDGDEGAGRSFHSNPVRVEADPDRRTYWGDVHLHSTLSDGTGSLEAGYRFGRDVMDLDVVAYTDHDTMGFFIPPSWQRSRMHDEYFERLCAAADAFDDPGEFVTLPAYEWTKQPNVGGHVNVYFGCSEDATLFDSLGDESNTYEDLWDRLREWDREHDSDVVTIPHHPAESMYPFDFASVDYDDELAPLVEVYSQWGSSERPGREGNRFPLEMGQGEIDEPGHYVQDAHRLGYRVGVMGGSDFHGPRPGHSLIHARPHLPSLSEWRGDGLGWGNIWRVWDERSYPGGLTAFLAPELSRSAAVGALRERSVYATTQPHRILVDFRVNGVDVAQQAGAVVVEDDAATRTVSVEVAGTAPVETVTVVKNTEPWRTAEGTSDATAGLDAYTVAEKWTDDEPITGVSWDDRGTAADRGPDEDADRGSDGDVYALRVRQASDGRHPGMAWAGPIWVEPRDASTRSG